MGAVLEKRACREADMRDPPGDAGHRLVDENASGLE